MLILGLQGKLPLAIEAAKHAAPMAKWTVTKTVEGMVLLDATSEYRIYTGAVPGPQSPLAITKSIEPTPSKLKLSTEQLVLVPVRTEIQNLSLGNAPNQYAVIESDLGSGFGYRWYAKGSLGFLMAVRRSVKLKGGEDPLALYARCLRIEDSGSMTRNTAHYALLIAKDAAIPYIAKEVNRNDPRSRSRGIQVLSQVQSHAAAKQLLRIYAKGSRSAREDVVAGVCTKPYLREFKPIYAQAIAVEGMDGAAAQAAGQFGWKEFLPSLRKQYPKSKGARDALVIYETIDQLTVKKIALGSLRAAHRLRAGKYAEQDVQALLQEPDKTYVSLIALDLLHYQTKGRTAFPGLGIRLLDSVPPKISKPLVDRFQMADWIDRTRKDAK